MRREEDARRVRCSRQRAARVYPCGFRVNFQNDGEKTYRRSQEEIQMENEQRDLRASRGGRASEPPGFIPAVSG